MSKAQTVARPKRRMSLQDMAILVAVYAIDFSFLVSGSVGLYLLGSWVAFVITLAAILLYAPRSCEQPLIVILIIASLCAVLLASPASVMPDAEGPC